jgi:plastocyanin
MVKNLKKVIVSVILPTILLAGTPVFAQDLTIADLGIESTGILPSNPFYFFKSFRRSIRDTFSWTDLSKAHSQLDFLNEQAAEIKQLNDINPNELSGFERAVRNYKETAEILKTRLPALKNRGDAVAKFLDLLIDRALKHKEILDELLGKFKNREDAVEFYNLVLSAEDRLAEVLAFVPGNIEDAKKFRERFSAGVSGQRGELREFLAAELVSEMEASAASDVKDILLKLKDDLLIKWLGRLKGMKAGNAKSEGESETIKALGALPGDARKRLRILDEAREKVLDSDTKNKINQLRQKMLDVIREERRVSKEGIRQFLDEVAALIKDVESRLLKDGNLRGPSAELLARAKFNLESAEKFYEEESYGSAYGAAIAASAAAKNVLSGILVRASDYVDELQGVKQQYDALRQAARDAGLGELRQSKLFAMFADAERQIAKIADLINAGSESPKIASALREVKSLLSVIEQLTAELNDAPAVSSDARLGSAGVEIRASRSEEVGTAYILISNDQFVPAVLKVKKGTRVVWMNRDSIAHWISASRDLLPDLDSLGGIEKGSSYSYLFDKVGTWKYQDHLNPLIVGIVDVE